MTINKVKRSLDQIKVLKATGPDLVSSRILKLSAEIIASLTKYLTKPFQKGTFPRKWKEAKIIPIQKGGDCKNYSHYRPISIICNVSKILERHIVNHFYSFLTQDKLIHPAQSGFRKYHSCEDIVTKPSRFSD